MPRAPNPQKGRAKKLWEKGINATEIAKELGIPEGTARRWKSEWEKENERSFQTSTNETSARNKRGAPIGNKNAVGNSGGGAPPDNKNNLKHGIYRRRLWRSLAKEDIEALEDMPTDEETLLLYQLKSLTMQEMDCMDAIARYQRNATGLAVKSVQKETEGNGDSGKQKTVTVAGSSMDTILRLEKELTSIQTAKTRCIAALGEIRNVRKLNGIMDIDGKEEAVTIYSMPNNGRNNG